MPGCLLVDGTNVLYRAFYAFEGKNLRTKSGMPTGALYGFTRMLLRILREQKPDFAAVAFDLARETFRHRLYNEYKAQRRPTPPELLEQMPWAYKIVEALGIKTLASAEYEADDLIGSLAERFKHDTCVTIVTGDRDMLQLIDDNVKVELCLKGVSDTKTMDLDAFKAEYGFPPAHLVDMKALWGDSSDNIPGVDGIGEKKALMLIREHGSLEQIYSNLDKISDQRLRRLLTAGEASARLSLQLATICRTVPEIDDLKTYAWQPDLIDYSKLSSLFLELEFTSLLTLLPASGAANKPESVSASLPVAHSALKPLECVRKILLKTDDIKAFLHDAGENIVIDIETDGFNPRRDKIVGIALSADANSAVYIPLNHVVSLLEGDLQPAASEVWPLLSEAWQNRLVIGHNLKFDLSFINELHIPLPKRIFDTMLAAYVLDPTMPNALKALSEKLLGVKTIEYAEVAGKRPFSETAVKDAALYAGQDAVLTMRLYDRFSVALADGPLARLYNDLELPLLRLLLEMEAFGIGLDRTYLKSVGVELREKMKELENAIYSLSDCVFNINSAKQLQEILFGKLGLKPPKKTKTGFSTDNEVLSELASEHQICDKILAYRELSKLVGTYVDSLESLVDPKTGLIHTNFNQTVTVTGRLSSSNPNLQNIPAKTELGRKVRRAFVPPRSGDVFLSIDYSQIELRLLAHFSNDSALIEAFLNRLDIHAITAARIFNKSPSQVSEAERKVGKTVNFGIIYGISAHGLARQLGIPHYEAKQYIDNFFAAYPGVSSYFEKTLSEAKASLRVETLFGRIRPLPELRDKNHAIRAFGERVARNTPLQGTAADLVKQAMLDADRFLRTASFNTRLVLQIHDEIVFSVPPSELNSVAPELVKTMEKVAKLSVPLICDAAAGVNLADLERLKF